MPISGRGWELHIKRNSVQQQGRSVRTVGTYQVFHDGTKIAALAGTTAEPRGPGSNAVRGNKKRVEARTYPLWTQGGTKYATIGYKQSEAPSAKPKPGIELMETGNREEIIIHPGLNAFLSSVGCINLCTKLPDANEIIDYPGSRRRVIALIEDLKAFLGNRFPTGNGRRIPDATVIIDGEP